MTRRLISSGSPFEEVAGYSRAVQQDPWVFVSGTSGYKDGKISDFQLGEWMTENYRLALEDPKFGTVYVLKRKDLMPDAGPDCLPRLDLNDDPATQPGTQTATPAPAEGGP